MVLLVYLETDASSTFLETAFALIKSFCRVEVVRGAPGSGAAPRWSYGAAPAAGSQLHFPRVAGGSYSAATVPGVPSEADHEQARTPGAPFPMDLWAALRFWLADEGHRGDAGRDPHDRLKGSASAQQARGLLQLPVVNAYLMLLRHWVEVRAGVELPGIRPAGKRCTVVLSHDVDDPLDPGAVLERGRMVASGWGKVGWARSAQQGYRVLRNGWRAARSPGERHWLFDRIMEEEARRGFRSTFYFASRSCFAPRSSALDVEYEVRSPRFRRVLERMRSQGSEVGLHVSYNARDDREVLKEEVGWLSEALGRPVCGARHHFWHMRRNFWETLEDHAAAGLSYDASVAFNEVSGFRLGLAHPARLWNPDAARGLEVLEVPSMLMDGALFYEPGRTIDAALEEVDRLVGTLKRWEGTGAVDWHVRTSFPGSAQFAKWGQGYLELLDLLAADPEVEVLTGAEVLARYG